MFYSIISIIGDIVTLEDSDGDINTATKDFFDYEVKENDLVSYCNGVFSYAKEETEKVKKENFDRLNKLLK